ncbi:ABC-type sugar transport system, periplasmic component [Serratia fonticola]|uniref:ABC-type sugar transport system, periplasmic component n=1 Tax=Serratia fonticola TaxID=47917 RepID=A0A3S5ATT9_SERFO|nr:ABC-type sugar transport system, periplasmic component [Serratia fonticola]
MAIDIFQSLKNCVFDLQRADVQNYQQPLKQLARLLNSVNLKAVNAHLTRDIDLDDFLSKSNETESSMAGSAVLQWPEDPGEILGLKLVLIDKMAIDNNFAFNFCHTFFYDRRIIESVRKFTSSLLVPFVRDYQQYVENQIDPEPAVLRPVSRKIFIVHGHDNDALQSVARFISRIGLEEIILSERPDGSRTIIEKFEAESGDVSFAIVLMTPDDSGNALSSESTRLRARQNVLYELGYFAGKLGRGRVLVLKKGEIEIPSDLAGVLYTELDEHGGWKRKLLSELAYADVPFDKEKTFNA